MFDNLQLEQASRLIRILFSCPGDVGSEKATLVSVVDQLRPVFLRHEISLEAWTFESNAVPALTLGTSPAQAVIDYQLPRQADGSIAYQLYVGLMRGRIGTPTSDAPSGTVHEFLEAKRSFESKGTPHILFYFGGTEPVLDDEQWEAVQQFRMQYPGLFANFKGVDDLAEQFRRHLLSELLDLVDPARQTPKAPDPQWLRSLADRYAKRCETRGFSGDLSAEKPARVVRQLQELLGITNRLSYQENRILIASLYAVLSDATTPLDVGELLGNSAELVTAVCGVAKRNENTSQLSLPCGEKIRVDLLGALVTLGLRLDLHRGALKCVRMPAEQAPLDDWLAYFTKEIVCERGLVRCHLIAPEPNWIEPLIGTTAVALESLWQQTRSVLTRYGMMFAVGRCQIELDPGLSAIPSSVRSEVINAAKRAAESLPKEPHFGTTEVPDLNSLLPLPQSKTRTGVVFPRPQGVPARLTIDGTVVIERGEMDAEEICYLPPASHFEEAILEYDEGEFLPVVQCRLRWLNPVEESVLESGPLTVDALIRLGLWNEALELLWPRIGSASHEDLLRAFHILREAFMQICPDKNSLLLRRDSYWDAMEIVRNRIDQLEG